MFTFGNSNHPMISSLRFLLLTLCLLPGLVRAGADGADPGFVPDVNGNVRCMAVRPNGEVYLGGTFTFVNGASRSFLARFNPDGSSANFIAVLDGGVSAIALTYDGKLVIGGDFTTVNGKPRARLARLFPDGALDEAFQADADAGVFGLVVQQDGSVVACGSFQNVDGRVHRRMVRVSPSGSVDDGFNPNVDDDIYALALMENDHLLIGGSFFSVNGTPRSRIARLDSNGVLDTGFDPGAAGFVFAIAVQSDGQYLVGGDFGVTRIDSAGTVDSIFNPNADGAVRSIAAQADGRIFLGGDFQNLGTDARRGIALVNADGSLVTAFDAGANGNVGGIALQADGKILVTGGFGTIGTQSRNFVARLSGYPAPQALTVPSTIRVQWLRSGGPELTSVFFNQSNDGGISWTGLGYGTRIAGGWEITGVNLLTSDTVNAVGRTASGGGNGSSGLVETVATFPVLDPDFLPNPDGAVFAMAMQPDGQIVAGGSFSDLDGSPRANLARVGFDGVLDPGFTASTDSSVRSIAVLNDGRLLIAGTFTLVNSASKVGLARLNPDGSTDLTFTIDVDAAVNCLLVQPDGKILLGGAFSQCGGAARNRLARLNADGTLDATFDPGVTGNAVHSLARQQNGDILIGGDFTQVVGTNRNNLARINATGSLDVSFDPNVNGAVFAMVVQPGSGKITLGGGFSLVGTTARNFFARVLSSGAVDAGFDPAPNGLVQTLVLQADGKLVVGGEFDQLAGLARHKVARLNADDTVDGGFDPNADGFAYPSLYADGRVLLGGFFSTVNGATRNRMALLNNVAAKQTLSAIQPTAVQWVRDGSAPEAQDVTFELSTDGGSTWQSLGLASQNPRSDPLSGVWFLGNLTTLPASGKLRARAHTFGGFHNASASLVEAVADFFVPQTAAATGITSAGATLAAAVNTNSPTANLRFEYSPSSNFAGSLFTLAQEFSGSGNQSIPVTGLQPNTTYFYRAVVFDAAGPVYGTVLSFTTAGAVFVPVVNTGGDVTGADPGTKFFEFGAPAIDGGVIGGAAIVKKTGGRPSTVIYGDTDSSVIASTGQPDGSGSTFIALGDPVFAGEALGFTGIAKVSPPQIPAWLLDVRLGIADLTRATTLTPGAKLAALYSRLSKSSSIKRLARQGGDAAGVNGGVFAKIPTFGLPRRRAGLVYTGKLRRGGEVSAKNDFGVWRETSAAGESEKLVGTGDKPDGTNAIKTLKLMVPVTNATDQRRSFAPDGGVAAAAAFDNGDAGVVRVAADGSVDVPVTRSTAVPDEVNATFREFDPPATASGGRLAFLAALRAAATGQPAPASRAIFSNRDGALRSVARVGGTLPGNNQQRFASLGQPLMGQSGMIGFIAALKGTGVTPSNRVALIQDRSGTQSVVARLGDPAAEFGTGPVYRKFQSVVVTDTATGHMVFTGTTSGKNLTKKNRQGLWAISAAGTVKLLLRSDQPVKIGNDTPTVRVFQALVAKPASQGQGRTTDEAGFVSVKVTLSDGRKGVLSIPLPP